MIKMIIPDHKPIWVPQNKTTKRPFICLKNIGRVEEEKEDGREEPLQVGCSRLKNDFEKKFILELIWVSNFSRSVDFWNKDKKILKKYLHV